MVERDSRHDDQNTQGDSIRGSHNTADQDENEAGKQHDDGVDQVSEESAGECRDTERSVSDLDCVLHFTFSLQPGSLPPDPLPGSSGNSAEPIAIVAEHRVVGERKNPTTALIISILIGGIGVDCFYIGDIGLGIGKLLTLGGLGIWALVDWFLIRGAAEAKNIDTISEVKASILAARPAGS